MGTSKHCLSEIDINILVLFDWILEKSVVSLSENFANSKKNNTFSRPASPSAMQQKHCKIRALRGEKRDPNSDCTYSVHC